MYKLTAQKDNLASNTLVALQDKKRKTYIQMNKSISMPLYERLRGKVGHFFKV